LIITKQEFRQATTIISSSYNSTFSAGKGCVWSPQKPILKKSLKKIRTIIMGNTVVSVLQYLFFILFYLKRLIVVGYYSLYALFQDEGL